MEHLATAFASSTTSLITAFSSSFTSSSTFLNRSSQSPSNRHDSHSLRMRAVPSNNGAAPSNNGAAPVNNTESLQEAMERIQQQQAQQSHSHQSPQANPANKKKITLLGSTGSIGTQTLDIVSSSPENFEIVGLAAGSNVSLLLEQARQFSPKIIGIRNEKKYEELQRGLQEMGCKCEVVKGEQGIIEVARYGDADIVVTGIVGCAGLLPTISAIKAGKDIALANKETLISGGPVVVPLLKEYGVRMTPADSEHSAIFQCLQGSPPGALKKIILTASGGAFREWKKEDLRKVTLKDALKHPNWSMGAKITIDSASLYNKAAEVIEAHYLFGVDYDDIEAVIHKQSIIHSMVEFQDSSVVAQLGWPDMRLPLLYSISWPHRVRMPYKPLDLVKVGSLTFDKIDYDKYPNMKLAYSAGRKAGTMTCVLNAANEAAVEMFREEKIHFLDIAKVNEAMMEQHVQEWMGNPRLEDIVNFDQQTRVKAREWVEAGKATPIVR